MESVVERRPIMFTLGLGAAMIAVTVVGRITLQSAVPSLTLQGVGLILNWVFVALAVGLVAWLGWWEKIRLMAPVNRRALIYLLPFAVMVFIPFAFGLIIPEISLVEGTTLLPWAALVVIVVGVALRLESLWPLVLWHFAVDVTGGLLANPSALLELLTIGLIFVVFVVGVGLLWQDRRLEARRAPAQAEVPV